MIQARALGLVAWLGAAAVGCDSSSGRLARTEDSVAVSVKLGRKRIHSGDTLRYVVRMEQPLLRPARGRWTMLLEIDTPSSVKIASLIRPRAPAPPVDFIVE